MLELMRADNSSTSSCCALIADADPPKTDTTNTKAREVRVMRMPSI